MKNKIFIGTYTKREDHVDGQAKGIFQMFQDKKNGHLEKGNTAVEVTNPSYLAVSLDNKNLYAVSELGEDDAESGFVYSYKIDEDQRLTEINRLSTGGYAPCYITVDSKNKFILVSNYIGGVVVMYQRLEDGSLKEQQQIKLENPSGSHAHSVNISIDNQQVYVADLGNDKIWIFDLDTDKGKLTPNEQPYVSFEKGTGPRHLAFSLDRKYIWTANELGNSISILKIAKNGGLDLTETISSVPEGYQGENSTADIHLHPNGRFLYVSNRGHNSIASYAVDKKTGRLSNLDYTATLGETPRNFAIGPGGDFLYAANQDSNDISLFSLNAENGKLALLTDPVEVKTPVCIVFAGEQ